MSEQRRTLVRWIAILIAICLCHPAAAEDEAPAPESIKTEYEWVSSEAGKRTGLERLKSVISAKKKRYISIEVLPDKEVGEPRVTSFHERDADGTLRKYFRKIDVRLGKGIRAFRRGVGIRMVGTNQKLEPVEIPKASEHHIWDPGMLSGLTVWLERASRAGEISFKVLDIAQRSSVTARIAPADSLVVGDPEGKASTLACWKVWSGGAEVGTICSDAGGAPVAIKAGRRGLLLNDWTWKVPEPKPDPLPGDGADAQGAEGGADAGEEPGVGP